ncbi:MAG: GNAT family N-acetyltransferase [Gammaproteobacteria bacterium]
MALAQAFVFADPLAHYLKDFDCGKPFMNEFLPRFAVKHMQLGLSSTWVLVDDAQDKATVAAYFTLASATVSRNEIPFERSLPRYPVPVVLLARLAIDKAYQGKKIGEKTLVTALRKSVALTQTGLPALGLVLDVLDEDALGFYQRYNIFEPFTDDPMRLFAPMTMLAQI